MKGELQVFAAGQTIFNEGDPSRALFFIKEGKIEVFRERDGVAVQLAVLNPGDVLGTVTLFSKEARTASARALVRCTLMVLSSDTLDLALNDIPLWAVAILKDAIARLKNIDERLVESKLIERKLLNRVGTSFHHGAQLAHLLAGFAKNGTITVDEVELFPLKGFIARAEMIILQRAEYLQKLFDCFSSGGLIKIVEDKKYGPSLRSPKVQLIEDFGCFCLNTAKVGMKDFVPSKYASWMTALVRVQKKFPERETWTQAELIDCLAKDLGRKVSDVIVSDMASYHLIKGHDGALQFSAVQIQRRLVFESVCRGISDCGEPNESR